MPSPDVPVLDQIRLALDRSRGTWAQVSQSTGVSYHTITKIAQGRVADPRIGTCQRLLDYFKAQPQG